MKNVHVPISFCVCRKESLRLLRKMCHYVPTSCLSELCDEAGDSTRPPFAAQISEVLAVVLENEEDFDGHLSALHILQDLLGKVPNAFGEQFARLGLPNKILSLAGPALEEGGKGGGGGDATATEVSNERRGEGAAGKKTDTKDEEEEEEEVCDGGGGGGRGERRVLMVLDLDDAPELAVYMPFQWRDWSFVCSPDCLYLWNEYSAIELSNVSNGWFRFLVDNKLATMYSSGSTEGGPDSFGETH